MTRPGGARFYFRKYGWATGDRFSNFRDIWFDPASGFWRFNLSKIFAPGPQRKLSNWKVNRQSGSIRIDFRAYGCLKVFNFFNFFDIRCDVIPAPATRLVRGKGIPSPRFWIKSHTWGSVGWLLDGWPARLPEPRVTLWEDSAHDAPARGSHSLLARFSFAAVVVVCFYKNWIEKGQEASRADSEWFL